MLAVAQLLTNASAARSFRNEFQAIRNASVTGGPPAVHFPFAWDGSLLGLLGLAVAVAFLRWQHSAASVARGLGYPARVSPGLGVGGWFIPFGNFWLPYQSLVDCLPPDHPARAQCLYSWLAFMAFTVIQGAAFSVALLGGPVIPLVVVAAALLAASVGIGWSCVAAIEADHARAAGAARPGW